MDIFRKDRKLFKPEYSQNQCIVKSKEYDSEIDEYIKIFSKKYKLHTA